MSIPAMVSAIPCDRPVDVQDVRIGRVLEFLLFTFFVHQSFAHMAPLVYYYGSADPQANIKLYQNQISEISKRVEQRIHAKANGNEHVSWLNSFLRELLQLVPLVPLSIQAGGLKMSDTITYCGSLRYEQLSRLIYCANWPSFRKSRPMS